ncbi:hypothetical protein AF335_05045 [Streptomyces eurocidicus]|uniref:S1 motif domain-containing protein n=1 Tax=Streptomyces eurocidicus TaxID=66423 RepID=A0A2N8NZ53_STREU|nr:hypothetical protein [Streptomyces eurocidicus]MBB5122732.1 hypothetical protein [Streptomyces eurocidicus]MBF6055221.1 hypothetical protein [Streptomyces eurocidicus]PNE34048.1 hypothetical protein AF335_05045 [Streptomyces eurocidicus]
MNILLHQEIDVTVVAIRPWGLEVEAQDGTQGLIDKTKDPAWRSSDRVAIVGDILHAVVIDDERDPIRLSALDVDLNIARMKRSAKDC